METKKFDIVKLLKIVIPAILAIIIANIAPPEDLTVESMRFAGLFVCMIIWMVLNVWPDFVITLVGLTACVIWKVADFGTVFAPFSGTSVWLVIGAFGISAGVAKSGLLKRLSYMILSVFPENFKGQVLALFSAGFVISPLIPSLNAKAAILAPFSAQVSESLGYEKGSKGARGLYGAVVIITTIVGMAFFSGAVPVATLIGMMPDEQAAGMHWMSWFSGTWLWMVVIMVLSFLAIIFVLSRKPGCPWKTHEWKGWKHVLHCFKDAAFSIVAPFLTFVCIAAGITTATEAASVIIVFVLLVGTIVYKKIKFKDLLPMMIRSAVMSAAILMIASMAGVMGWVLAIDQIPQKICNLMISMTNSRIAVLFIIQIFLLFVGMFMDAAPAVLILVPVFMPIMKQYGIDPVHFGLLMCFNLTIGVLTPPVGTCLYTTAMATGVPVDRMIKGIWPWIGVLVVVLFICTYWEGLILFIPRLLGYGV